MSATGNPTGMTRDQLFAAMVWIESAIQKSGKATADDWNKALEMARKHIS